MKFIFLSKLGMVIQSKFSGLLKLFLFWGFLTLPMNFWIPALKGEVVWVSTGGPNNNGGGRIYTIDTVTLEINFVGERQWLRVITIF